MKQLETLQFKKFCMTIGNLPASYVDSMSYYECLLWLIKYLQEEVIPTVNNNSEAVTELQQLFIELKSYVDNYFDNLDVQEEINNKLDEMVEDGSLEEILRDVLAKSKCNLHYIRTHKDNNVSGNNTVINTDDGNVIIDFGFDTTGNDIIGYLASKEITTFKYAIITHYHGDHVGGANCEGLLNILDSPILDFSECTFYLPALPNAESFIGSEIDTITTRYNTIIAKLESLDINYVIAQENDELTINDKIKLKILNASETLWTNYYDVTWVSNGSYEGEGTNYNNFSLVIELENLNNYALFPGDIENKAEEVIFPYLRGNYNIYTAEHHGADDTTYKKYLYKVKPSDFYVVPQNSVIHYYKQTNSYMRLEGVHTLGTVTSEDVIVYTDGYSCNAYSKYGEIDLVINKNEINLGLNISDLNEEISSNADLDDYTKPGLYRSPSGAVTNSLTNCPLTATGFKLEVEYTSNANFIRQTITPNNAYNKYTRYKYQRSSDMAFVWSSWTEESNNYLGLSNHSIASNSDLNDYSTPGIFIMGSDSGYTHTPTTYPGVLIVRYLNADNRILQEVICNTTKNGIPLSYKRLYGTSGWTNWVEVDNNVFDLNNSIANNTDLNTLTTPGAYYSGSAAVSGTLTNSPVTNTGFRLEVIRISSASSYRQVVYPNNAKTYYVRIKAGSTSEWTAWTTVTIE